MGLRSRLENSQSSCVSFLVVLSKRIDRHDLTGLSAQISYYFCLALFPFLILLAAVIGLLPFTHLWDDALPRIIQYFPQNIQGILWDTIGSLVQAHKQFLSAGLVGTVWAASRRPDESDVGLECCLRGAGNAKLPEAAGGGDHDAPRAHFPAGRHFCVA